MTARMADRFKYGVTHTFGHCRSDWDYNYVSHHLTTTAAMLSNSGLAWVWPWLSAAYEHGRGFIAGGTTSCGGGE